MIEYILHIKSLIINFMYNIFFMHYKLADEYNKKTPFYWHCFKAKIYD